MSASAVLVEARRIAGLSQRGLAEVAGTAQSVVGRIENGAASPTWETLSRLVKAAGLVLEARARTATLTAPLDQREVARLLALTPRQRLAGAGVNSLTDREAPPSRAPLDPTRLTAVLASNGVRHVLVGAIAARLYGAPRLTAAMDIVLGRDADNLQRLTRALHELDARLFVDGMPGGIAFDPSVETLVRASTWHLTTVAGRIDLRFDPAGVEGCAELEAHAERFWIGDVPVAVASLDDLMRMKDAVDRPSDRADIEVFRALRSLRAKP